jgi:DNA-directed RNA polymerase specialized sigma24 family protein
LRTLSRAIMEGDDPKDPPSNPEDPPSGPRLPSSDPKDPPSTPKDPSSAPSDPPSAAPPEVSRETLEAYLGSDEGQDVILRVVLSRLTRFAPEFLVNDLVSEGNFACVTAKTRPRAESTMRSWVAGTTLNAARAHFRANKRYAKHFDGSKELEELEVAAPESMDTEPEGWLLEPWLDERAKSPRDRETLELLRYKAQTGKTDEQVCADKNLTIGQLRSRVHYFKKKHAAALAREKARRAERNRVIVLWLKWGAAGVVVAGIVGFVLWALWPRPLDIGPDPSRSAPSAPSASAAPAPPPLDQALPPELGPGDGGFRPK